MTYSDADFRAQAAPACCRHCVHVELHVGSQQTHRYQCRKAQLMADGCVSFSALPDSREVSISPKLFNRSTTHKQKG